jgi:small subunit ribosomal protein S3
MGQKIHPTGFRLAVTQKLGSRWYANSKDFPGMLNEDVKVREYLKRKACARFGWSCADRAPG